MEVDGVERQAALGGQPARDRRIDAARQQQQRAARRADGQPTGRGLGAGEHERHAGADLDAQAQRGRVDVDGQAGVCLHAGTDAAGHVHRADGEALVGAARFDLERRDAVARDRGARGVDGGGFDGREIGRGFDLARDRQRHQPEHALQAGGGVVGLGLGQPHEQPAVRLRDARGRQVGERAPRVVREHALERAPVPALEEELAVSADNDAVHAAGGSTRLGTLKGSRPAPRDRSR